VSAVVSIELTVNGARHRRDVEPRLLLSDFLRQDLGLTGTHVGCEHGVCGACTILFDGEPARSCIMLAAQADGHEISTVESLASADGELNPLQAAFRSAHALQCGFCTPGMLMTLTAFLRDSPTPDEPQIRDAISANLCRCTGYQHIVHAVQIASGSRAAGDPAETDSGSRPEDPAKTTPGVVL
jgi:aerobic-type carbon monoxide dehydrogenase small subunit (CoxS/CutS family)